MTQCKELPKVEEQRQKKNFGGRQRTVKKNHGKNFWVLDTETSGFKDDGGTDEPIQIVALLYKDGQLCERHKFKEYYNPEVDMTKEAMAITGLDLLELKWRCAKPWTL